MRSVGTSTVGNKLAQLIHSFTHTHHTLFHTTAVRTLASLQTPPAPTHSFSFTGVAGGSPLQIHGPRHHDHPTVQRRRVTRLYRHRHLPLSPAPRPQGVRAVVFLFLPHPLLCTLHSALCALRSSLCTMRYALCSTLALCALNSEF